MKQKSIIVYVLLFCISIVFSFSIIVFSFSGCTVEGDTQYQEIYVGTAYTTTLTTSDDTLARFTPTTTGTHTILIGSVSTADITLILSPNDDFTNSLVTDSSNGLVGIFTVPTTSLTAGIEYYLSLANSGSEDTIYIEITQP